MYETIQFPNGHQAALLRVAQDTAASAIAAELGLAQPRAVLILNGETGEIAEDSAAALGALLGAGLARVVAEEAITVISGGTDAGIFQLFGTGLARWGRSAPCIGVAVEELAASPGQAPREASLEPHHSHFVLVRGRAWGDETATMYELAAFLAQDCPSLAVFAGGGQITLNEMASNVRQGREMIFLAGSGRSTDAVLAASHGEAAGEQQAAQIAAGARIAAFDIGQPPSALRDLILRRLAAQGIQAARNR